MIKHILLSILFISFNLNCCGQEDTLSEDPDLMAFELDSLVAKLESKGTPWLPLIQGKNVLTGLYMLKVGTTDRQQPHDTDEVYFVASGKGKFVAGGSPLQSRKYSFCQSKRRTSFF